MRRRWLFNLVFITLALLSDINGTSNVAAQSQATVEVKTLTLGMVSETHRKEIEEHFRDFMHYVARKLSSGREIEAKVVTAATPVELAKLLEQRKIDFYMESAYPTYVVNSVHGAGKLLLRRWKSGMAEYYSVIFTRRNSGIKRLEDLKGKTIVFEDPGSTSGYLMPKLFLQRRGLKLTEKARVDPMTRRPMSVIFLPALRTDSSRRFLPNKQPPGLSATTILPRSMTRKRVKSHSLRKPTDYPGTWYRCGAISRRHWSQASKRFRSRCMTTWKERKSCKKPTAPSSSTCSRAEKRQCAGDFWKAFISTRQVNHVKIRGNDGQKIFLRESVR